MAARRTQVSKTVTTRTTQSSRRVAASPDVEGVDEEEDTKPRAGLPDALVFATTLMLLLAIVITDYWLGKQLGAGVFFKP